MPRIDQHIPTDETRGKAIALTTYGYTQEEIADYLGICVETYVKNYRQVTRNACLDANSVVAAKLYKKATQGGADGNGDLRAQEIWLKCRERKRWGDQANTDNQQNQSLQQVEQDVKRLENDCPNI
jgi:hypothetical protein